MKKIQETFPFTKATVPPRNPLIKLEMIMAFAKYNMSIAPCCIKKCQLKAYNNPKTKPALKPVLKLVMLAYRVKITA